MKFSLHSSERAARGLHGACGPLARAEWAPECSQTKDECSMSDLHTAEAPRARSKRDPGRAQRTRARPVLTSALGLRGAPHHACHPENQQFDAGGAPLPVCAPGQTPANGCYAPTLRCGDAPGFINSAGAPVSPRPTYWLDRTIEPVPTAPTAARFDRGGFLDGARRKWGEQDATTLLIGTLGDTHGVSDDVGP